VYWNSLRRKPQVKTEFAAGRGVVWPAKENIHHQVEKRQIDVNSSYKWVSQEFKRNLVIPSRFEVVGTAQANYSAQFNCGATMSQENPYDPPQTFSEGTHLARKARRLQEQRDEPITLLRYLGRQWRRHVMVAVAFALLGYAAIQIDNIYLTIGLASFWAGRITRDLQWYRTLVLEWSSTKELLDWEKIQRLAS